MDRSCTLVVERCSQKDFINIDVKGSQLFVEKFVAYLSPRRFKDLKIKNHDLVLIKGERSKTILCIAHKSSEKSAGGLDYYTIYLNKLARYNLDVIRGDVVSVQPCKCQVGIYVEIALMRSASSLYLSAEDAKAIVHKHFSLSPGPICKGNKFIVRGCGIDPIVFKVVEVNPNSYCLVTSSTSFLISSKIQNYQTGEKLLTNKSFEDIGGYEQQIKEFKKIEFALRFPSLYREYHEKTLPRVILSGPPAVGKSLFVKVLANESGSYLVVVDCGKVLMEFDTTKKFTYFAEMYRTARQNCPSILCLDKMEQIDSKIMSYDGIANMFTEILKGFYDIVLMGITNEIDLVTPKLIDMFYSTKMDCTFNVEFPKPSASDRVAILSIHLRNIPLQSNYKLAFEETKNFSGGDIAKLCEKVISRCHNKSEGLLLPCGSSDIVSAINS